jgi:hypothetical protein
LSRMHNFLHLPIHSVPVLGALQVYTWLGGLQPHERFHPWSQAGFASGIHCIFGPNCAAPRSTEESSLAKGVVDICGEAALRCGASGRFQISSLLGGLSRYVSRYVCSLVRSFDQRQHLRGATAFHGCADGPESHQTVRNHISPDLDGNRGYDKFVALKMNAICSRYVRLIVRT